MNHKSIANTLRIVVLAAILSTVIGYSFAAWTPPSGVPPFNNVPPPINVGPASQIREGNLFLNNWLIAKKAQTQSTVASDVGTTLVTKDYVDVKIASVPPNTDNQTLSISGKTLGISGGNSVTLPSSGGPFSSCITVGDAAQGRWYSDGATPTCPTGYTMNGIQTWGGCSGGTCGSNVVCCI